MSDTASDQVIAQTRAWVNRAVIGLNLCPFAKAVQMKNQIRYVVSDAGDEAGLLMALCGELRFLARADPEQLDTTLLIHPRVLGEFARFNEFVGSADAALQTMGYEGLIQLASFHPHYQFAGTDAGDVSNATNRSPYPTLHLLREASVTRAVAAFPKAAAIFEANIRTLQALGLEGWEAVQAHCKRDAQRPSEEQ